MLLPKKWSERFLPSHAKRCSKISHPKFFLCMSFSSAQRSCHELLHWFVTKSVRAIFLSYRRKMFQSVGSRAFLHTISALKMTIPDLVRKCKRDTLPPSSVPRTRYFFHLYHSFHSSRGSKRSIPFLIEVSPQTVFRCDTPIDT
jgi:hypothetical protein